MFLKPQKKAEREPQTAVLKFPNGTVIENENGDFFYIKNDVRLKINNEQVLASWRFTNIPLFSEDSLKHYPVKGKLPFRDGTVLVNQADKGKEYYVSAGRLRLIENPRWFDWLNINANDVIIVSKEDFDNHVEGEPLR